MMRSSRNGFIILEIERASFEMVFSALMISLSLLFNTELFAREGKQEMGIVLVAIGEIDKNLMDWLKKDLSRLFNKRVVTGKGMPEAHYAYNKERKQYLSTTILNAIMEQKEDAPHEKILGIVDHDLFVPELNFVLGEASRKAAIISLTRLRQPYYHLPEDRNLFFQRVLTEATHELGHTFGLRHCNNPRCVMFFSNSLMDTDRKGSDFCQECKNRFPPPW
jgi:archaemetzincin